MTGQTPKTQEGLVPRVVSALVLMGAALLVALAGGRLFALFVAGASLTLMFEWTRLVIGAAPSSIAMVLGVLGLALLALMGHGLAAVVWAVGLGLLGGLLVRPDAAAWLCVGGAYVAMPALASLALRAGPDGLAHLIWLFGIVWITDTGAFLAGRLLGGPPFAPLSSPNKTWTGLWGGGLAALALAAPLGLVLGFSNALHLVALAGLLSAATHGGDIAESALKRHFGVKDTGRLIPGHGGLLDRLDGFLFAVMVLAVMTAAGAGPR